MRESTTCIACLQENGLLVFNTWLQPSEPSTLRAPLLPETLLLP